MTAKYNPKDKFTAKPGDFEVLYMPPKKPEKKGEKAGQKPAKKK